MKKFLFILIILFSIGFSTEAQESGLPAVFQEQWTLDVDPEVPGTNQKVNLSVRSYLSDFNNSLIEWFINNQFIDGGIGMKTFSFTTGEVGETKKITVKVTKKDGSVLTKDKVFSPGSVELVFQAFNYVPPFYKGKSVFTHESSAIITAIPRISNGAGGFIPKERLTYQWFVNGGAAEDLTYGKYFFEFEGYIISRETIVGVEVSDSTGIKAYSGITLVPREPVVLLYESNPLYGTIYEKALLNTYDFSRNDIIVDAVPYFFTTEFLGDANLEYKWFINGNKIDLPTNQYNILLQKNTEEDTVVNVIAEIGHINKMLQTGRSEFNLNIQKKQNEIKDFFSF
jgi:hypothetical protein